MKKFTAEQMLAIVEKAPKVLEGKWVKNALHEWSDSELRDYTEQYTKTKADYHAGRISEDEYDTRMKNHQMDVYKAKTHCMLGAMQIAALDLGFLEDFDLQHFGEEDVTAAFDYAMQADSEAVWDDWLEKIPSFNDREKTTEEKVIKKFKKLKKKLKKELKAQRELEEVAA